MQPSAALWSHFHHLYRRIRRLLPQLTNLAYCYCGEIQYFQHLCNLTCVHNKSCPERGLVFCSRYHGPCNDRPIKWPLVDEFQFARKAKERLPGVIYRYHFAGRWRRIKEILPEHVDVVPQGPTCLWVSRGVTLFQPSPRHLCDARWGLAWDQSLCPFHKQLVRHFPFLYCQQLSSTLTGWHRMAPT